MIADLESSPSFGFVWLNDLTYSTSVNIQLYGQIQVVR